MIRWIRNRWPLVWKSSLKESDHALNRACLSLVEVRAERDSMKQGYDSACNQIHITREELRMAQMRAVEFQQLVEPLIADCIDMRMWVRKAVKVIVDQPGEAAWVSLPVVGRQQPTPHTIPSLYVSFRIAIRPGTPPEAVAHHISELITTEILLRHQSQSLLASNI